MNKISALPRYNTLTFSQIFANSTEFIDSLNDFNEEGILFSGMTDEDFKLTYLLLLSRYADHPINSLDTNHFLTRLVVTINNFGPQWAKRRNIRNEVLEIEDIHEAAKDKTIYNQAEHPAALDPLGTGNDEIIQQIDRQTQSILNPNQIRAYENYVDYFDSMTNDLDMAYIDKFKDLFTRIVSPQRPILFIEEDN